MSTAITDDFTPEVVELSVLLEMAAATLRAAGLPDEHARWMADWLVDSDLNGVHTHGLRLLPTYLDRALNGGIAVQPRITMTSRRTAVLSVDGDNGFGQVVATATMRELIERAREVGAVTATVHNSNHLGALSYLARMATSERMFVFACQNTRNNTVPFGGRGPGLGNNPLVWAMPIDEDHSVVLDMACSETARGRLKLAQDRGESIELGWAVDEDGNPTTDPARALKGALMPFGRHKGSGIAFFSGAMSGVLSGANFGTGLPSPLDYGAPVRSMGHFISVVDIEALLPWADYVPRMADYISQVRASVPAAGGETPISLPGERSAANRIRAAAEGVPVERRILRLLKP